MSLSAQLRRGVGQHLIHQGLRGGARVCLGLELLQKRRKCACIWFFFVLMWFRSEELNAFISGAAPCLNEGLRCSSCS